MYGKGKAFIGASILLRKQASSEPNDYVALHLLCQGIEITFKGLLLLYDYDRFKRRLRKPLGHDLFLVAVAVSAAYGLKPLRDDLGSELGALSNIYSQHLLRYGSMHDIFINPSSIPHERVFRRLAAVLRLTEREFRRS